MSPAPPQPINSGFTADSTIAEVLTGIDLTGQLAIVTGGYSGIGAAVTRGLSDAGATMVVRARRPDTARAEIGDVPPSVPAAGSRSSRSTTSVISR